MECAMIIELEKSCQLVQLPYSGHPERTQSASESDCELGKRITAEQPLLHRQLSDCVDLCWCACEHIIQLNFASP